MTLLSTHGINLHYEVRGDGAPLLLLHGFTGFGGDWVHAGLENFAPGRTLVIPDLRGHGRSTNTWPRFTHRQCAEDVLALLDHLGLQKVKAIGLSLGGNTLFHLETLAPGRVEAMITISATMYFPKEARAVMAQIPAEIPPEQLSILREKHRGGDEQIRALWSQQNRFAEDYDDLCFTPAQLSRIKARTLIVYGDRDPLYPVEMGLAQYRALPNAELWVVPGGGHGPIFGEHREEFVKKALQFLA